MENRIPTNSKPKEYRKPASHGHLITLSGAVMIHTKDGNVVLTPQFAAEIARLLPQAVREAQSAAIDLAS